MMVRPEWYAKEYLDRKTPHLLVQDHTCLTNGVKFILGSGPD